MKTNVVMVRQMGGLNVFQRTSDGFFDANELLIQWNKSELVKGRRKMSEFLESPKTKELIDAILADNQVSREIDLPNNQVVIFNKSKTSKSGKKDVGSVYMHPYLFIDFAMWLNPTFKVKVLKFVYDELIQQRHFAGDNYKVLSTSGVKLEDYNFSEVAKAMQWIIFGHSGKGLRQTANQEQLIELNTLQTQLSFAIDMGYIKTYEQLIGEMRKIWNTKNEKF